MPFRHVVRNTGATIFIGGCVCPLAAHNILVLSRKIGINYRNGFTVISKESERCGPIG